MREGIVRHIFFAFVLALLFGQASWSSGAEDAASATEGGLGSDRISLDGTWQIIFDRDNEGREDGWCQNAKFGESGAIQEIPVPSCWEMTEKDYEGVAYYCRTFDVPAAWKGRVVRLHFDAVNFRAEVWLNGREVGIHEGGFTPFEFRVDEQLQFDAENTLIVRVVGPILLQDKRVDGMGPMETPQWRGAISGGIWQSVQLVASGDVFVDDIFVEPHIADNTASIHGEFVSTAADSGPVRVDLCIRSANAASSPSAVLRDRLALAPGANQASWTLEIPDAQYWSPDNPHLYRLDVSIYREDRVSDHWSTKFGMREFTIRDQQFQLNGKPLYLKATFLEGLYPVKLAYPDSREMAMREIQLAKEAGFNMIRPWRKPPPPMWLDLADEMGVLTVGSLAIECMDFPVESPRLQDWVRNEVRESILRDRNRACVVQWELFNELKRPVLKEMLHPMSELARELDPTRLILDESGGWAQGANMFLPYESAPTKFNDIHDYPGQKVNDEVYQKLLLTATKTHEEMRQMGLSGRLPGRNVVTGLMTYFSELGYGSLPDLPDCNRRFCESGNPISPPYIYHRRLAEQHSQVLRESGFEAVYPDLQQFCLDEQRIHGEANKRMIEAVRCNPHVKGYCIHALVAGDWIIGAGLLDIWRNPKTFAYEGTKQANQPRILSLRVRPRNIYAEQGASIEINGVSELADVEGDLRIVIATSDGQTVLSTIAPTNWSAGISSLLRRELDTSEMRGSYTLKAEVTTKSGDVLAANQYAFDVFTKEQLEVPRHGIAVFDPSNSLTPFLRRQGIAAEQFDTDTDPDIPVFVSRTEAKTPEQRQAFHNLADFARRGGTVVYLQGGGPKVAWGKSAPSSPLLPIHAKTKRALGHWICIPRLVHSHPIFSGLPTDCMMGPVYENVWAQSTLQEVEGQTIAASIGYDWFPDYDLSKRHYYGPGDAWWGADVVVAPLGQGRCVASQLRVVENLGKDPVADIILYNLIRWSSN